MSHGGKGDARRPSNIGEAEYAANWDTIFGKSKAKEPVINDDVCSKCNQPWLEHDFGVPQPSCP